MRNKNQKEIVIARGYLSWSNLSGYYFDNKKIIFGRELNKYHNLLIGKQVTIKAVIENDK